MKVKSESEVAQLCLTLRDPMDCSLPGSSAHGIFQAREYWSGVPSPSLKHTLQESKLEQGFPGEPVVKNSSANAGEWAQSLLQEDPTCRGTSTTITKASILGPARHSY